MKWLLDCRYFHKPLRGRKEKVVSYFWDDEEEKMVFFEESERTVFPFFYTQGNIEEVMSKLGEDICKLNAHRKPEYEKLYNPISGMKELFVKLYTKTPSDVGGMDGIRDFVRPKSWQDNVKYHYVYALEKELNFGMPYDWDEEDKYDFPEMIHPDLELDEEAKKMLSPVLEKYGDIADFYFPMFFTKAPKIEAAAIDIEVATVRDFMPDAYEAAFPVVAISIVWSSGKSMVLQLKRENMGEEWKPKNKFVKYFESEAQMLSFAFEVFKGLPTIVLTYNGDNFDFSYMHHRARRYFGINTPFYAIRKRKRYAGEKTKMDRVDLMAHIHVDLFRWFSKNAVKNYVYKNKYQNSKLDTVSKALLGYGKLHDEAGEAVGTDYETEGLYCEFDSKLCIDLWNITKHMVFIISRLSHCTLPDTIRRGATIWHANLIRRELYRRGWIFSNRDELKRTYELTTKAMIGGKKYQGAIVKAEPGIYALGTTLDYASLYPSVIENYNLSFETMDCECCDPIENKILGTGHWVCQKKRGIIPELYGFLRAVRVAYFKPKKMKEIEQGIKVFINSAYGVFGNEMFAFYCPALAECTTAGGRMSIESLQLRAEELGIWVYFGDTDSCGMATQDDRIIQKLIDWAKDELDIELEIDYKFKLMFLYLKKNYVVIFMDNTYKVSGMMGKKKHVPELFKKCFNETIEALTEVEVNA